MNHRVVIFILVTLLSVLLGMISRQTNCRFF